MIDADDSGTDNNLDNQDLILSIQDGPGVGVLGIATPVPFLVTLPGLVGKKKKNQNTACQDSILPRHGNCFGS